MLARTFTTLASLVPALDRARPARGGGGVPRRLAGAGDRRRRPRHRAPRSPTWSRPAWASRSTPRGSPPAASPSTATPSRRRATSSTRTSGPAASPQRRGHRLRLRARRDAMHFVTLSARATTPDLLHAGLRARRDDGGGAHSGSSGETTGMELALVMDNTGSLWADPNGVTRTEHRRHPVRGAPERRLRADRRHLWRRGRLRQRVGQPGAVRRQREHRPRPGPAGWLPATGSSPTRPSFRPDLAGGGWKGCVMARAYPNDINDATPAAQPLTSLFYAGRPPPTTTGRRSTTPTRAATRPERDRISAAARRSRRSPSRGRRSKRELPR